MPDQLLSTDPSAGLAPAPFPAQAAPPSGSLLSEDPRAGASAQEMNYTIVNGQRVPLTEPAIERYGKGVAETVLPSTTANDYNFFDTKGGAGYAVRHPLDSAGLVLGAIKDAHLDQARKTATAFDKLKEADTVEGKLSAAADLFQHALGASIPLVGPGASSAVDTIRSGNVARGLGELTGIALPFLAGQAMEKVPATGAAADLADRLSTERMSDAIAPKVGRQKQRFGNMAQEVAPELARDPRFSALSRQGLAAKVEAAYEEAKDALDAAHDARNPATSRYSTQRLIDTLTARRQQLVAEPVDASLTERTVTTRPSPILDEQGRPQTVTSASAQPLGQSVIPPQNQAAYNALSTSIDNLKKLGPVASYDDLRTLRMAWDKSAEKIYTPSVVQDFLTARDEGLAWSKASGELRDFLASKDPMTAAANAKYSLLRRANDVLSVTEETERTRPHRGAQMVMSGVGAMAGSNYGPMATIAGAMLGPVVDSALTSGVTTKITTARVLATLADALRVGNDRTAVMALRQVAQATGQTAKFDALLKGAREAGSSLPAVAGSPPNGPPERVQR